MKQTTKMEATIQINNRIRYIVKSILFCVVFTAMFVAFSFLKSFVPNNIERLTHGISGTIAALVTTALFLKFDRKRFSDIGLVFQRNTFMKFFVGVIVGTLIMGLLATTVLYFSDVAIKVNSKSNFLFFLLMTLPLLPLAFMEELGFRAYPLQILKDKIGIRLSILTTSILFALYHIANGWSIASSFYGPAIWGLVFGLAAVYANGIAMPTGIHYAANLTTAAFSSAGSSFNLWIITPNTAMATKHKGIDWTTILPSMVLFVVAIVCIEVYLRRKAN